MIVWKNLFSLSNLDITPANVDSLTSIIFYFPLSKSRNKVSMQCQQFPGGFWLSILFIHRAPVTLESESNSYGDIYGLSKVNDIRSKILYHQTILFSKPMSEKIGSDIERIWNWISRSIQSRLKMASFKFSIAFMSDPTFSDIDFENKMAWVWTTLKSLKLKDQIDLQKQALAIK